MIKHLNKGAVHPALQWHKPPAPPIQQLPLPDTLRLPLPQGIVADNLLVSSGSQVLRGQPMTISSDLLVPLVHASSSGVVSNIDATHIEIKTDGMDNSVPPAQPLPRQGREQLIQAAHNAGLTGQGGAGFPVAAKLQSLADNAALLLVNAAECDPRIHCDDALIQQQAPAMVEAMVMIAGCCAIDKICIGIESNQQLAIDALQNVLQQRESSTPAIQLVVVPDQYPSGAERTLLKLCTGRTHDQPHPLSESGVLSMNIATCYAVGQVISTGLPCTQRVTTVITPDQKITNVLLRTGTSLEYLLHATTNGNIPRPTLEITVGGQMMPTPATPGDVVTQSSNCVMFSSKALHNNSTHACIRCGLCADVCPEALMPQQLHRFALHFDQAQLGHYHIERCIECRCCDVVCPSRIPLAQQFHAVKQRINHSATLDANAELARIRYEKRQQRLTTKAPRKKLRTKPQPNPATTAAADARKALIEAALARSRQKNNHSDNSS
ncbi:MAG: electron transport complex subunit RsxC [Pseudomonadota bacterium]